MPRYELCEGTSNKFWEIELAGPSFTTTYGRIGSAGQTTTKSFDSDAKAQAEYTKLIAEKTKKGYQLVGASSAPPPPPAPKIPKPAPVAQPVPPPAPSGTPRLAWTDAAKKAAKKELDELAVAPIVADNALGEWKVFVDEIQNRAARADKESERLLRAVSKTYGSIETMPKSFEVETAAEMLRLASSMYWKRSDAPTAVHHLLVVWAGHTGLPFALDVFAAAVTATSASTPLRDLFHQRADRVLRGLWLGASEDVRTATRAHAETIREGASLLVRSAIASSLLEPAWIDEDLRAHAQTQQRAMFSAAALLAASSPGDVATYVASLAPDESSFYVEVAHRWAADERNGHATIDGYAYAERFGLPGIAICIAFITNVLAREGYADYRAPANGASLQRCLEVVRLAHDYAPAVAAAIQVIEKIGDSKLSKEHDPRPAAYDTLKASASVALPLVRDASKRAWAKNLLPQLERLAGGARDDRPEADPSTLPAALKSGSFARPPEFWVPAAFPRIALRDGTVFPSVLTDGLGGSLKAGDGAAIEELRRIAEPESLAAFGWDLFQAWMTSGAPSKDKWAFNALGQLGSDETARRLTPLIRAWPGESQHQRAVGGLEVLSAIGSDVALMMLNGIAQKLKYKGLQDKAREKMDEIAARRGITAEQLSDRLVPDLDLEDDGSRTLDFGPRSFRVGFDETLSPFVTDATGTRLKDLPKPNSKDDTALAATATETWKAMKKDARALSAIQILRLELAMGTARRWTGEEFRAFFVEHPLLTHLVRRLVWGAYTGETLAHAFRVAEDRTYADQSDDATEVASTAQVGIVHRLHLRDEDTAAWGRVFADYELAQPFEQLSRAVYRLTPAEAKETVLARFHGRVVETKKLVGLLSRGWRKGPPQDAGQIFELSKPIRPDLHAVLTFSMGINAGGMEWVDATQTLENLDFGPSPSIGYMARTDPFVLGTLDPVVVSEVIRDIEAMPATGESA